MKRDRTRQEIIDTAKILFSEHGRYKVTMGMVAEASAKCRRTIYNYFLNIETLYVATIQEELNRMLVSLGSIVDADIPADEKLKRYVYAHFLGIREATERNTSLRDTFLKDYELIEQVRRQSDLKEIRMLRYIINQGNTEGTFEIRDLQWSAMIMLYAMKGIELPYLQSKIGNYMRDHISSIMEQIFNGLRRRDNL